MMTKRAREDFEDGVTGIGIVSVYPTGHPLSFPHNMLQDYSVSFTWLEIYRSWAAVARRLAGGKGSKTKHILCIL